MALVLSNPQDAAMDIPDGMPTTGPDLELRLKMWTGFELLYPFLCNPGDSPICAASVSKITRLLLVDPCKERPKVAVRILRTQHKMVLDAILHLVAIPRHEELQVALGGKLDECHCDLTLPVLHTIHQSMGEDETCTFKDMIESLCWILQCVLENVKVGRVLGVQGPENEGKWPSNTAAFFPAGPEDAIVSLTQLYRLTKAPSILGFITAALPHSPSLAAPAVNSPAFLEVLLQEMRRASDGLHADPILTGIQCPYNTEDGPLPLVSLRAIVMLLQLLLLTFTESLRQNIQSSALISYARVMHDVLLKVLIELRKWPLRPALEDFCVAVTGMAMLIITTLPKSHPMRPRTLNPFLLAEAERTAVKGGVHWGVYSVISRLSQSVARCCNATCTTTSESSSQRLRYCAQCEVMRYCSPECQKRAWRYHKLICQDLEKLKKHVLPACEGRRLTGKKADFMKTFEKESLKQGLTRERMKVISAELTPFLHFENAGMTRTPTHQTANHT
ncbi:hypothetical protein C8R46DRAFT_356296 [Mycena filopes]|nr:hypothetical protein C8R46DRAFT_356296 [Mycena filopes]